VIGVYFPELHDVAPPTRRQLDAMLELLSDEARSVASVLVVPNWEGRSPIDADPSFVRDVSSLGGCKVLHGFTHSLGARWSDRLFYGTSNESEFARLNRSDAAGRLEIGRRLFEAAFGAPPRWFCAPRWQASEGTCVALEALGIPGRMFRDACVTPDGRSSRVPAVWFDDGERALTRAGAALVRRARIGRLLRGARAIRVSLHPRDVSRGATRRAISDLFSTLHDAGWVPRPIEALPVQS
jgi:predicted deacetylase